MSTRVMCARLQAGHVCRWSWQVFGYKGGNSISLLYCFSNSYLVSVMFSSKIIVDDDGNDDDGDSLGVWMGSCCGRTPDPSARHI